MKVRCTLDLDMDLGTYDVNFKNVSNPDNPIDYTAVRSFLEKVFENLDFQVQDVGHSSEDEMH